MTANTNITSKVPEWLEAKLFETILKENVKNFKDINEFKANASLSELLTTSIDIVMELQDGSTETKYFTLKTRHEMQLGQERKVYDELLPALEKLYKAVGNDIQFSPEYFKLPIAIPHILLEDLSRHGFKTVNRLECLDMQHAKIALQKMSQLHAVSAVYKENNGCYDDCFKTGIYNKKDGKLFNVTLGRRTEYFLKCIHLFENHEEYKTEIENMLICLSDELLKASLVDDSEFNVLNHGDCRTNNILFQYTDKGEIIDSRFMNYDLPKYGSPAQDLLYFIISSLHVDIKIKQFDHLIQYYHENLIANLQLLRYPKDVPTLKEILIMLYKYGIWGFTTAIGVLPAVLDETSNISSFDQNLGDCVEENTFKLMMMTNTEYIKQMNTILPWLLNRGCLDYNIY